jgi:predicted amidophosphoribosyltransferase
MHFISRMEREQKTVETMIRMYCNDLHQASGGLCPACRDLLNYANKRLNACPFQEGKTTCAKCPVHCYQPEMRERIRTVMKHSGPRMIHRRPLLALMHLMDRRRKSPLKQDRNS